MFDMLTRDERAALNYKLADWAHRYFEIGHTLARTALADDDLEGVAWTRRERYCEARAELVELRAELAA